MNHWTVERNGRIAVLTLNRPPINTISFVAVGELHAALCAIENDPEVSVVVLTGAVPGYFMAHADLEDIGRMARHEPPLGDPDDFARTTAKLESMPQPTVAAVNGQAWGGGCELSLACTWRLAAQSAHFRLHEVSRGAIPGGGGTQRLPRLIGVARASVMILASRLVTADAALALGLADAVLPDAGFMRHVTEWLAPVAAQPPHALFAAKRAIIDGLRMPLELGLANEQRLFAEAVSAHDFVDR
jgi:enoyl-CoA hydratase